MPRLEKKLIELGYKNTPIKNRYIKVIDCTTWICIWMENKEEIEVAFVINENAYTNQQDINDLQKAYYLMQRDLEILKGVEDDNI